MATHFERMFSAKTSRAVVTKPYGCALNVMLVAYETIHDVPHLTAWTFTLAAWFLGGILTEVPVVVNLTTLN